MFETTVASAGELHAELKAALVTYRRAIFVDKLRWQLPLIDGQEIDQFDRPDTIYVVGRDETGEVCGCARLLPTIKPYLLGEVFPQLMGSLPLPCAPDVWEISRFSSTVLPGAPDSLQVAHRNTMLLLTEVVRFALRAGARRLITVSTPAIERLLRRTKVHSHRVAPPVLVDGKVLIACWIEVDDITLTALASHRDVAHSCATAKEGAASRTAP